MSERIQTDFYQLKAQSFFENFAGRYLAYLGNMRPNKTQLTEMMDLLSHVWLRHLVTLDSRLTDIENQCLYLFSQGKTTPRLLSFSHYLSDKFDDTKKIFFESWAVLI